MVQQSRNLFRIVGVSNESNDQNGTSFPGLVIAIHPTNIPGHAFPVPKDQKSGYESEVKAETSDTPLYMARMPVSCLKQPTSTQECRLAVTIDPPKAWFPAVDAPHFQNPSRCPSSATRPPLAEPHTK